ncbi:hypothetical protein PPYR_10821 [Photinus pyralis]|uniref:Sodium/solute symporter n=2 Tax=Photinus pyralis TaxID=7054 RepID=A0A5N4AHC0_PHOPY|nr:sodium-coupled monocarboxylate transporter 2-like [Photinus pyralis]KAB0796760.1 hypothetical protein PPYR_10821 [Photinus pyralis]
MLPSTLSSSFNATATLIYKDFIVSFLSQTTSHQRRTTIIKMIVVILGIMIILLELIVKQVDGVFPFVTALVSLCGAPLLGLFTLGVLFPRANSKGALIGAVSAVLSTGWLVIGNITYSTRGLLRNERKPLSIAQCDVKLNRKLTSYASEEEVFILYRIAFWYYALAGTVITVTVGVVVSCCTKREGTINPTLVNPMVRRFLHTDTYPHVSYNADDVIVNEKI